MGRCSLCASTGLQKRARCKFHAHHTPVPNGLTQAEIENSRVLPTESDDPPHIRDAIARSAAEFWQGRDQERAREMWKVYQIHNAPVRATGSLFQ